MLHLEHTVSFTPVSPALHESRRHFFDIRMLSVPYLYLNLYNQNYSLFTSLLFLILLFCWVFFGMCPDLLSSLILFICDIFMETFLNKTKEAKENITKRRY